MASVSYTPLRPHETTRNRVCPGEREKKAKGEVAVVCSVQCSSHCSILFAADWLVYWPANNTTSSRTTLAGGTVGRMDYVLQAGKRMCVDIGLKSKSK